MTSDTEEGSMGEAGRKRDVHILRQLMKICFSTLIGGAKGWLP
jgi:hypothetical protein